MLAWMKKSRRASMGGISSPSEIELLNGEKFLIPITNKMVLGYVIL